MKEEHILWKDRPSQLLNLTTYFKSSLYMIFWLWLCSLSYVTDFFDDYISTFDMLYLRLSVPVLLIGTSCWAALRVYAIRYVLTTETLVLKSGILTRYQDELELYRVKDYIIVAPLILRFFGLANLTIISSDRNTPKLTMQAVGNVNDLKNKIRDKVEELRVRKRVMEID